MENPFNPLDKLSSPILLLTKVRGLQELEEAKGNELSFDQALNLISEARQVDKDYSLSEFCKQAVAAFKDLQEMQSTDNNTVFTKAIITNDINLFRQSKHHKPALSELNLYAGRNNINHKLLTTQLNDMCTRNTELIIIHECTENTDYERFFNYITEGIEIKKEDGNNFYIHPRFVFVSEEPPVHRGDSFDNRFDLITFEIK